MIIVRKIFVVWVLGLLACNGGEENKSVSYSGNNRPINKISLKDLNEQIIDLGAYKGKTIFVNFWATWCKPCIAEMASIEKAQNILRKENVVFLMASSESAEEINAFQNAHNYQFKYTRIENSEDLNIQALPTTFIFNAEGKLVFSETGYRKWDEKNNIDMIIKIANKDD